MNYKLTITERAEELLDNNLNYLINQLKNSQAAGKLTYQLMKIVQEKE